MARENSTNWQLIGLTLALTSAFLLFDFASSQDDFEHTANYAKRTGFNIGSRWGRSLFVEPKFPTDKKNQQPVDKIDGFHHLRMGKRTYLDQQQQQQQQQQDADLALMMRRVDDALKYLERMHILHQLPDLDFSGLQEPVAGLLGVRDQDEARALLLRRILGQANGNGAGDGGSGN